MHYYGFHIGDYTKKTHYLTDDEDLAYRRILDLYYDTEIAIENDPEKVSRKIRMPTKTQAVINVLNDFFKLQSDGRWHEDRCDRTIASYQAMSEGGKAGAEKRWGKKVDIKGDNSQPIAPLSRPHRTPNANQEPITIKPKLSLAGKNEAVKSGDKFEPDSSDIEILPTDWQTYAENLGIPDDQIFTSWRKFKSMTTHPFKFKAWKAWIDKEKVRSRK